MIARGEIDVVARIAAARGSHVLRVERVLEREDDAVHRHLFEIGIAAIRRVELGGPLERIGLPPENLAHGRRVGRQRPFGRMPVVIAATRDGSLAADVEGGQRIHLPGVRHPDDHAELLPYGRVGGGGLHAAEFERWPQVFIEIGQQGRCLDGLRGEAQRRLPSHGAGRFRDRGAVFRHEHAGDPVIGAHALDVLLDDIDAGRPPLPDRLVQFSYRRFFDTKRLVVPAGLIWHCLTLSGLLADNLSI